MDVLESLLLEVVIKLRCLHGMLKMEKGVWSLSGVLIMVTLASAVKVCSSISTDYQALKLCTSAERPL